MQKVIVKSVSRKEGDNDKGHWINTRVTGEDGAVFGTFHKSAAEIKEGDTIELEPIVKGKNVNFDIWKFLEKSATPAPVTAGTSSEPQMSKEDWARKNAIERISIEVQTAIKSLPELVAALRDIPTAPKDEVELKAKDILIQAIEWCRQRLIATSIQSTPVKAQPKKDEKPVVDGNAPIKNVGDLLTRCMNIGVTKNRLLELTGKRVASDIADLEAAWHDAQNDAFLDGGK